MDINVGESYRHYKNGKTYIVLALGYDADTAEEVVVYQAEYADPEFGDKAVWVRKRSEFSATVAVEGVTVERFKQV